MIRNLVAISTVLFFSAVAVFLLAGCEISSTEEGAVFRIEPSEITLTASNRTVVLQAVGGHFPFEWDVTDESMGSVSGEGEIVTYTRGDANGANTVKAIDGQEWVATATIIQQNDPEETAELTISPTTSTLESDGDKVVFTGIGGVGTYTWSVGNSSRGGIISEAWSQAIYTRNTSGNNTAIVTDEAGHVAIAEITQPAVSAVTISPTVATVSTNQGSQVFTASGGTESYTWAIVGGPHGSLSPLPLTGSSKVYTSLVGDSNSDVILVTDGNTTAFATVNKQ